MPILRASEATVRRTNENWTPAGPLSSTAHDSLALRALHPPSGVASISPAGGPNDQLSLPDIPQIDRERNRIAAPCSPMVRIRFPPATSHANLPVAIDLANRCPISASLMSSEIPQFADLRSVASANHDGRQHLGGAALERPVVDAGDAQRALFPLARLRDIHAPDVRCPISLAVNGSEHRLHPFPEGLLCLSHGLAVHPWSRALRNLTQIRPLKRQMRPS